MGRPPPGRDTNPPPRSPGRVLDPMRAMERGDDEDRDEDPDDDVHLDDEDAFGSDSNRAGSRASAPTIGPTIAIRPSSDRRREFATARTHTRVRPRPIPPRRLPPPARPFVSARASVRSRVPRVPRVPPSSRRPRSRRLATRRRWKVGARPWWRRWTARRTVRIIRRYLRVRRASARWFARARGRPSSFPRTRAGAAEVEKSRAERSAAAAAAAVAAHHASPRERETPPRRRVDVGDAAATRRREEETRANRRFGSGFDSATAARAREAERARKRDAEAHARGEGEPNRDRRGARTDRRGARTPPRGRTVGDREGYRSFAPASPGGGVYRPPASPRAPTPPRTRLSRTTDASPNASRPTRPMSYRTSTAERAARFQERRAARKRRDAAETETRRDAETGPPRTTGSRTRRATRKPRASGRTEARTSTRTSMKRSRSPPRRKPRAGSPAAGRDETRVRTVWRRRIARRSTGDVDRRFGNLVTSRGGFARRIPGPAFGRGGADDGVS